jgi:hypothetical protein
MSDKEHVNRKNTRIWVRMNEDSRSSYFRDKFVKEHGGQFVKDGRYWKWIELDFEQMIKEHFEQLMKNFEMPAPVVTKERGKAYVFKKNNEEVHIQNLLEYCMDNNLMRSAMYDLMNGKRKSYKGYKFLRKEE